MKMLISIHEEHVNKIFKAEKKYEFRKVEAKLMKKNDIIFFYKTKPYSLVVGKAKIKSIIIDTPDKVWEIVKDFAGIDNEFYYSYYGQKNKAIAYELYDIVEFSQPKKLKDYGIKSAPQSFVYLK